jgi:phosphatidylglycerophosphatase A
MTSLALAIATVLGVGRVPVAPGTFGSMVGLVMWAALGGSPAAQLAAIVVVFVAGSWSGGIAERHYGASDPGAVVIDEVLGMLITLVFNPVGWTGAFVGFLLFRVFDVIKPYPANRLERLHGGLGIMCDDAMAAVYANMVLRMLVALLPPGLL